MINFKIMFFLLIFTILILLGLFVYVHTYDGIKIQNQPSALFDEAENEKVSDLETRFSDKTLQSAYLIRGTANYNLFLIQGDSSYLDKALPDLQTYIQYHPENAMGHVTLARIYLQQENLDKALHSAKNAYVLAPKEPAAIITLAGCLLYNDHTSEALDVLNTFDPENASDKEHALSLSLKVRILLLQNDIEHAKECCRLLLEKYPNEPATLSLVEDLERINNKD